MFGRLTKGGDLRFFPTLVTTQFLGELASDLRRLDHRGASIEEKQPRAAGEHVLDGASHFVSRIPRAGVLMASRIADAQIPRDARPLLEPAKHHRMIDGIFGHVTIRRPFSSGDRKHAGR